jgi:uncharacterized protein YdhG (YjbR/CyaY superfamily)
VTNSVEVDAYIAALPEDRAAVLATLRKFVHDAVPGLTETMSYRMPTFESSDIVCSMASQKNYMALYVCGIDVLQELAADFAHLNCGKSCIRFKKWEDLPLDAVRKVLTASAESPGYQR